MATKTFDTQHQDMIHDAQMDYYGKRIATCSSDKTIKIFDVQQQQQQQQQGKGAGKTVELIGHEGPVWQIGWAPPKFGSYLASCSYDRRVIIWQEDRPYSGNWRPVFDEVLHELSVNSIAWAPQEFGLALASASSDGYITILTYIDSPASNPAIDKKAAAVSQWHKTKFLAHQLGVNAVSWAPAATSSSLVGQQGSEVSVQRLVSGGCDNLVKIWEFQQNEWKAATPPLAGHSDWVRDVSWAPNVGLSYSTIASCSQDGSVIIWTQTEANSAWKPTVLVEPKPHTVIWRVSWSITGNILAVSSGDNTVTLWKETDGQWRTISTIDNEQKQD